MGQQTRIIISGVRSLFPIIPGVIPFGLIMGTVATSSGLSLFETMSMNFIVLAGASQLAAIDLMNKNTPAFIVVMTGVMINLRFMVYSASLGHILKKESRLKKLGLAYILTDQAYAVSMNEFEHLNNLKDRVLFYVSAGVTMCLVWHVSTLLGALFGNVAPKSISLDFAVPLTFMALLIPSLKNRVMIIVAMVSSFVSILAYKLPYNLGFLVATSVAMIVGVLLSQKGKWDKHG